MRKAIFFLTGLIAMTASLHSAFAAAPQAPAAGQPAPAASTAGETVVRGEISLLEYDDTVPARGGVFRRLFGG